ncbi:pantetheine-phosphate adenylyltransferase family protein-like protein [Westerdykella ornata]|uniref:Pantetheine-phosphate adenylyltransferase family protein-like protein n=1 Tax=Westerdykella ornata TaxID=318751 RepID=A0A6A6JDM3_WESOR|nr:pantetheine-phosphate adenylyltransferase family protein-like protein [Westerdykella ornata]KAF2273736.1 pantetheine-phosphate adenylyltransferase family protein-like protein [Westerdykella ornata]
MPPTQPLQPRHSLLLLPPAPSPPTYATLKAAYGPSLVAVLRQLAGSSQRARETTVLDIALPCPHLYGRLDSPRGPLYALTQTLVANIYKLLAVIAASESIETQGAGGVDARVLLVAYPRDGKLLQPPEDSPADYELRGPAVDLYTLARCPRAWELVFSVENEEGEQFLKNFVALSASERAVSKVQGGRVQQVEATASGQSTAAPVHHSAVAVGGTFDHLHIGHKLLLTMFAFVLARQPPPGDTELSALTIGITGDALLVNKKHAEVLESWDYRQRATHDFLSSILHLGQPDDNRIAMQRISEPGPNGRAVHVTFPSQLVLKYVQIEDPFGPTITDESITALVISKETRSGGSAVNAEREKKGWASLEVFEVDVLDASEEDVEDETFQSKLSSTEIRRILSEREKATAAKQ